MDRQVKPATSGNVVRNAIARDVRSMEHRPGGCQFEEIRPLVVGSRGRAALQWGDIDGGVISAGQSVGLIDDVPSCADLIERIVAECRQRLYVAFRWAEGSRDDEGPIGLLALAQDAREGFVAFKDKRELQWTGK